MSPIHLVTVPALKRMLITASTVGGLLVAPISAQPPADGARVRITLGQGSGSPYEGVYLRSAGDTIWFREKRSHALVALPIFSEYRLEQSTRYKRRWVRGLLGAGIGLVIWGGANVYWIGGCVAETDSRRCHSIGNSSAAAALGGVFVAAPAGAIIGATRGGEQWKVLSLPRSVSTLRSTPRPLQLASFKF